MISIKYSSNTNKIIVIQGKSRKEFTAYYDVNLQSLNLVKGYFVEEITRLCHSRINALNYATIKAHTGFKKEILIKVSHSIGDTIKYPNWADRVLAALKQLKQAAPGKESRYYKNYSLKLLELYNCLQFYKDKQVYYEVEESAIQLNLFDTQSVTSK